MKTIPLKRFSLALTFVCALLAVLLPASVRASSPTVLVLKAEGEVAPAMRDYLARGMQTAESEQAELLIIELNTPGGLITSMTEIVTQIRASRVPVVIYVTPRGGMAASAGTLITLAGHAAAMAPETIIGAASPVNGSGQDLGETMKAKESEALKALVRSIAARRSPEAIRLAEATIDQAKAVSVEEAKAAGLVDFIASDRADLLKQLDGFTVQLESGPRTLKTGGLTLRELPVNFGEQILNVLFETDTIFLLLALGLMALLIEISSPGGWVAGFIGVVSLALAVYGLGLLTVNWFGLVFVALALVLFVLDLKAPTHGALTLAGIGSFIVGALVLFNSPGTPKIQQVSLPLVIVTGIILGLVFAVMLSFALKAQKTPLRMGQETLIGALGTAKGPINPHGQVQLRSELWSAELAEGAEALASGENVVVVAVEGLRLKVRRA
jgi:membrane-bound serine protease (ClpP class)